MATSLRNRATADEKNKTTSELEEFIVPNFTVKDLLSVIPAHCFERSALRSSLYIVMDVILISACVYGVTTADKYITPEHISLPHPFLYRIAQAALWTFYGFCTGLPATGLWVVAHECGHQAFSPSKTVNNAVGWVLHSALGVPYHSWRISHAKHHAHTGHLTQDQVFVPKTRSSHPYNIPAFDPTRENLEGSKVETSAQAEMWEALGDTPLSATLWSAAQLILGWPLYLLLNSSGQKYYPAGTNHFNPRASALFKPTEFGVVLLSDLGIIVWLAGLATWVHYRGLHDMLAFYFVPYLWVNHWLVMITFLQHTDPLLPHYRASAYTFPRGALCTFDRNLMGGPGPIGWIMGWIGQTTTHGISETHVAHHVASKIPHYHAWEANAALHKKLLSEGYNLNGGAGTWGEVIRIFKECKFVEDEGDVVFFKNAKGVAIRKGVFKDKAQLDDSGIEVSEDEKTKTK